jgi:excisionase family DNA binding protein
MTARLDVQPTIIVNVTAELVLADKQTACRLLGNIAERTLRQLVHDGELSARKLGSRTMFELDELRRFAAALPSWEPG